jgi:hypothetical protein
VSHTPRFGEGKHRTVGPREEEPGFKKKRAKNRKRNKAAKQARKRNRNK